MNLKFWNVECYKTFQHNAKENEKSKTKSRVNSKTLKFTLLQLNKKKKNIMI